MALLRDICLQFVGSNAQLYPVDSFAEIPVIVLELLLPHLPASELQRIRPVVKATGLSDNLSWKKLMNKRWPKEFQKSADVFGERLSQVYNHKTDYHQMYIEKHFQDVLRYIQFGGVHDPVESFRMTFPCVKGRGHTQTPRHHLMTELTSLSQYVHRLSISHVQCPFLLQSGLLKNLQATVGVLDLHSLTERYYPDGLELIRSLLKDGNLHTLSLFHPSFMFEHLEEFLDTCAGYYTVYEGCPDGSKENRTTLQEEESAGEKTARNDASSSAEDYSVHGESPNGSKDNGTILQEEKSADEETARNDAPSSADYNVYGECPNGSKEKENIPQGQGEESASEETAHKEASTSSEDDLYQLALSGSSLSKNPTDLLFTGLVAGGLDRPCGRGLTSLAIIESQSKPFNLKLNDKLQRLLPKWGSLQRLTLTRVLLCDFGVRPILEKTRCLNNQLRSVIFDDALLLCCPLSLLIDLALHDKQKPAPLKLFGLNDTEILNNSPSEDELQNLAELLSSGHLGTEHLDISAVHQHFHIVDPEETTRLRVVKTWVTHDKALRHLTFREPITFPALLLTALQGVPQLETLSLIDAKGSFSGWPGVLAALPDLPNLRCFRLRSCLHSDKEVVASSKFVDAIVNHPTLAEVDLSQNDLGSWGCKFLLAVCLKCLKSPVALRALLLQNNFLLGTDLLEVGEKIQTEWENGKRRGHLLETLVLKGNPLKEFYDDIISIYEPLVLELDLASLDVSVPLAEHIAQM